MIQFDFAKPFIIYIIYNLFTFLTILTLFIKRDWWMKFQTFVIPLLFLVILYSQIIRYILPLWEGNLSLPFFPSRLAALLILVYLLLPIKKLEGIVYFIASTSIIPVLIPMGSIDMVSILDETFFIDHYIGALFPFYLLTVKAYKPNYKTAFLTAVLMLGIMLTFILLNTYFNFGDYFFMHEDNILLEIIPGLPWTVFAIMFSIGLFLFYCFYTYLGKQLQNIMQR